MPCHADSADALAAQPDSRRQHQVRAILFQQINRTDIRLQPLAHGSDKVGQRLFGVVTTGECRLKFVVAERGRLSRTIAHGLRQHGCTVFVWENPNLELVNDKKLTEASVVPRG